MARQTLREAVSNGSNNQQMAPQQQGPRTIQNLLADPKMKQQIAAALPKHMTSERMARIVLTEVRKVPKLMECDQMSLMGAVMQASQLGLEPGAALGHCYLLPFNKRKKEGNQWVTTTECQLIIGYRGMLDLSRRSGQILSLEARAIYEKDHYVIRMGLDSTIEHEPAWELDDRGAPLFFYAVAKLKDGGVQFEVMSVREINAIRDNSQGYKAAVDAALKYNKEKPDSPWVTHYDEMAKKTVIRRLFKYLPVSIEMQRAVGLDEAADIGLSQHNALVIDANYQLQHEAIPAEAEPEIVGDGDDVNHLIHDQMVAATTEDELNSAWELGGPDHEYPQPLIDLYNKRMAEFNA